MSTGTPGSQLAGKGGGGVKKGQPRCVGIGQGKIKESGLRGWDPMPNKPTVVSVDVKRLNQLRGSIIVYIYIYRCIYYSTLHKMAVYICLSVSYSVSLKTVYICHSLSYSD